MVRSTPFTTILLYGTPQRIWKVAAAEAATGQVEAELMAGKNAVLHQNPIDRQVKEAIRSIEDDKLVVSTSSSCKG